MRLYNTILKNIYRLMLKDNNSVLYVHSYPHLSSGEVNAVYRAIIKVSDDYYEELEKLVIKAQLFYKKENPDKKRLPTNLPRFLDNNRVFKIQIHENRAYSSLNYKGLDEVPVARQSSLINYLIHQKENEIRKSEIISAFEEAGYKVGFKYDDYHQIMETLTIDAKTLCEKFECDSIQHRIQTGIQIRGNFFIQDIEQRIEASPLQSIGVLLLKPNQNVEILHSHRRRTRSDAKFTEGHPNEITLKMENLVKPYGRLYKCFNIQK